MKPGGIVSSPSIFKSVAGEKAVMAWYDSMLVRWPMPYETRTVPTRHGDTFIIISGKTSFPPLVLLHGAGTNSMTWIGDVVEFGREHCVHMVDLLGEPGKSAPNRPPWTGTAYVEWLEDVLRALNLERVTLIG